MLAGLALLRQNGRMLLRLDELDELEFAEPDSERSGSRNGEGDGLIAFLICPRPAARLSGHGLKSGTAPAKVISWSEPAETEPKLKDMG